MADLNELEGWARAGQVNIGVSCTIVIGDAEEHMFDPTDHIEDMDNGVVQLDHAVGVHPLGGEAPCVVYVKRDENGNVHKVLIDIEQGWDEVWAKWVADGEADPNTLPGGRGYEKIVGHLLARG